MKEIVIKLSDEEYLDLISFTDNYIEQTLLPTEQKVVSAIKHGTPLPKGHGRLIDADKFNTVLFQYKEDTFCNGMQMMLDRIDNSPTIIEADRSEEMTNNEAIEILSDKSKKMFNAQECIDHLTRKKQALEMGIKALAKVEKYKKAIENMRKEIKDLHESHMINFVSADGAVDTCLKIIDKHIGG